jgi:anaerobic selenocysteine-containing dehydrogenase
MPREAIAACRICAGSCSLRLTLDDVGRVVAARGDRDNPVTRGYACIKGTHLHEAQNSPDRLLHPLKRQADGSFVPIALDTALAEIATALRTLIERHGAEAIAAFRGTMNYSNLTANHVLPAFLEALGSNSFFSTMTIDQSAKWVTFERLGGWAAGKDPYALADVLMFVGTNPLVSLSTFNFALQNPAKQMQEAKQRGLKLVVIDPRATETARHADVFLQPVPGEDPTILAGLLRIVLRRGWHDAEFCARHVKDLPRLICALEPFTPEYVAARAGVSALGLTAAAAAFAEPVREGGGLRRKRGSAASGTGPNMAPHSNLAEHLLECLNVVCGRFARPGDVVPNPGVVAPRYPRFAEVIAPRRSWESGWKSRCGGYGMLFGQKMSGTLAQEITTAGAGQIRALLVDGGNPADAVPDQRGIAQALRQLDLLVCVEPFMTNTARLAHYVIPPKMMFERADLPSRDYESYIMFQPYAQYSAPVATPPAGSAVVDDWFVFWELARRLGKTVVFDGVPLDMGAAPTTDALLAILARHGSVPFEELRRHPHGKIFEVEPMTVQPGDASNTARFDVMPDDIEHELAQMLNEAQALNEAPPGMAGFTHRLAVRRVRDVQNTMYHQLPAIRRRMPFNPAFVHPEDLAAQGLVGGECVTIVSAHGRIRAIVQADSTLRRGVVSIPHGWGPMPDEELEPYGGANPNQLLSATVGIDPINAMPVMTAVPVRIEAGGA